MLELLIITMCAGDYECDQLLRAYRNTPQGKLYNKNAKELANKIASKEALAVTGSLYAAATNKKIKFRLCRGLTMSANHDNINLVYKLEF